VGVEEEVWSRNLIFQCTYNLVAIEEAKNESKEEKEERQIIGVIIVDRKEMMLIMVSSAFLVQFCTHFVEMFMLLAFCISSLSL